MDNLKITIVQSPLAWENPDANLKNFDSLLTKKNTGDTDLIVLPEMFTTGFTMKPEKNAEKHEGKGLQWMKQKAEELNTRITGSICVEENNKHYNRLYFVEGDGKYQSYNKRHLFRMGNEQNHYEYGKEKFVANIKGWKILPLVCYDLRFPVWSRNSWQKAVGSEQLIAEYDVLIYVANWPEARNHAWKSLLIARAIENQCYVIGVNRIGADGSIAMHSGDSVVINPLGEIISKTKAHQENVETINLDYEFLQGLRKKFPVGLDTDSFQLES
ncbi:MAG TPA: amidohydrolase [Bacteroidia bacterium]|jgi:omega-amidase|nr:amidohydrolase [Bacteroidia bacterium]